MNDRSIDNDFRTTGPPTHFANDLEMYQGLVKIWADSSRQLHRICLANGIEYYHFLQPNQYLAGSKPMSEAEIEVAIYEEFPAKESVAIAYPMLIEEGKALTGEGIRFHDLTMVFAETREPIYIDFCCHYNEEGNRKLAGKIADIIVNQQSKERSDGGSRNAKSF
jgi:hypothetical protein